ncbi:hypothetical protein [Paraclostridium bifermentans]|uniref:hypothetical protein n=1 Tax=Paraclostridium bifermentans TaxID=1490 RepID=UPI00374EC3B9
MDNNKKKEMAKEFNELMSKLNEQLKEIENNSNKKEFIYKNYTIERNVKKQE